MYWVEVRMGKCRRGPPRFWPHDRLDGLTGFRSVYAYPDDVRAVIERQRGTAGLKDAVVYSDLLLVDFDDCDPDELLLHLVDEGVGFAVWWSGGRSWHVHVATEPTLGVDVPLRQRLWVEAHAPGADLTFYHQAGQFRLPGTVHEKTLQRKVLHRVCPGALLTLPPLPHSPRVAAIKEARTSSSLIAQCLRRKGVGERRVFLWYLATLAWEEGVQEDVALRSVLWWNSNHCLPPLPVTLVEERVREVFAKRAAASDGSPGGPRTPCPTATPGAPPLPRR